MKLAFLLPVLLAFGGDESRGLKAFAEGRYDEAVSAFKAALNDRPEDPQLHYNLSLAAWRAGDIETAETSAEKAATLSNGRLAPLRDGILGNLRFDTASKVAGGTEPDLKQALKVAEQALLHFERGVVRAASPELLRNYERAHMLVSDLKKRIAEQEKQDKDNDGEKEKGKPDPDAKPDPSEEPKDPSPGEGQPEKQGEPKPPPEEDEGKQQQASPPEEEQEPSKDDSKTGSGSKSPDQEGSDAPDSHRLSPEVRQRLEEMLRRLEQIQQDHRNQQKLQRPKVERDW